MAAKTPIPPYDRYCVSVVEMSSPNGNPPFKMEFIDSWVVNSEHERLDKSKKATDHFKARLAQIGLKEPQISSFVDACVCEVQHEGLMLTIELILSEKNLKV